MPESMTNTGYDWVHPDVLADLRDDGRIADLDTIPIASSFSNAYDHLLSAPAAIIPKDCVDEPEKFGFSPSSLAIRWGAQQTYRDPHETNSVQLWEYNTYFVARLNKFNPDKGRLLEHALTDKIHYTVGAGLAAVVAHEWLSRRQSDN